MVNLVGILHQVGKQKFHTVQSLGPSTLAELAAEAGVHNLVHLSAIGADPKSSSLYARTKGEGERAVLEKLPTATVLRPSIVFGLEDDFFNRFAAMAATMPFFVPLPLIGSGKTRFQPVYVDDVADAVCEALVRPEAAGHIYELGGPRVYSFKELMKLMLDETGRNRLLMPVPFGIAGMIGIAGELFGKLPIFDPPLTRDQVKLLKNDTVVDESGAVGTLADLDIRPHTVEAILPTYMVRYRKYGQFAESPA